MLTYLMGILQMLALFLGLLTFFFDYSLFPILLFLLILSPLSYIVFKVDHYYDLATTSTQKPELVDTFAAIRQRLGLANAGGKTLSDYLH